MEPFKDREKGIVSGEIIGKIIIKGGYDYIKEYLKYYR